jgi:hypothetical protein
MSRRASLAEVKAALARDAAELGAPVPAADASAAASAAAFEALLSAGDGDGGDDAHLDAVGAWRSQATGARVAVRDGGGGSGPTARGRELYARAQTQRQRREAARAIEDAAIRAAANPALSRCVERARICPATQERFVRAAVHLLCAPLLLFLLQAVYGDCCCAVAGRRLQPARPVAGACTARAAAVRRAGRPGGNVSPGNVQAQRRAGGAAQLAAAGRARI